MKKREKIIIKREIYEKKEKEEKKERVREPQLHTLKQHMHTNQEAAPFPFQAFAAPLRSALAHMHKGRCTLCPQS